MICTIFQCSCLLLLISASTNISPMCTSLPAVSQLNNLHVATTFISPPARPVISILLFNGFLCSCFTILHRSRHCTSRNFSSSPAQMLCCGQLSVIHLSTCIGVLCSHSLIIVSPATILITSHVFTSLLYSVPALPVSSLHGTSAHYCLLTSSPASHYF